MEHLNAAAQRLLNDIANLQQTARQMCSLTAQKYNPTDDLERFLCETVIEHPTKGPIPFLPCDAQLDLVRGLRDMTENLALILHSRMMGITATLSRYILWLAANHPNRTIMIAANKFSAGSAYLDHVLYAMEASSVKVPFVKRNTKEKIAFSNGSSIVNVPASKDMFNTYSDEITDLFVCDVDSLSYSKHDVVAQKVTQLQLQNNMKVIYTSTGGEAKGLFWNYWRVDEDRLMTKKFRIPWNLHPDRDEEWAHNTMQHLGEMTFRTQYCTDFISFEVGGDEKGPSVSTPGPSSML